LIVVLYRTGGVVVILLGMPRARAANRHAFAAGAFRAAQGPGQTSILVVTAKWCGPCQRQKHVVEKLLENSAFGNLTIFNADRAGLFGFRLPDSP
jgi:thiol-disulfide isomerase/thioredoxin